MISSSVSHSSPPVPLFDNPVSKIFRDVCCISTKFESIPLPPMMLRIENGKRLKKDVKIQFRERCLETYRTYRKFNTIQKTFANRLYVNSTSIRSKFISSAEIQSREKRRTNKTRNWYLFRRSRSDKLSRVILILTFSLTLSHSHTHIYVHLCFHRRVEKYISCRIDRPIERSAVARIVTMQFAWRGREGGVSGVGVRKWHVHAWCLPGPV